MKTRDEKEVERLTTKAGLASLEAGVHDEKRADVFERWGKGWTEWEIRWKKRTEDRAEAWLGPEVKEHGLVFVRVDGGWKLDRWSPGE